MLRMVISDCVGSTFNVTFGIPGFKLGFANIMIIIAIYALDARFAFGINLFRIILSALLFGTPFSMMYSLAGGMLSLIVMLVLKKTNLFSVIGVSMAGGVFHNLGQLCVAAFAVSNIRMFIYFPVLVFTGIATGIGTGDIRVESMAADISLGEKDQVAFTTDGFSAFAC